MGVVECFAVVRFASVYRVTADGEEFAMKIMAAGSKSTIERCTSSHMG